MTAIRWASRRKWGFRLLNWWYGASWRLRHPGEAYRGWRFRRWLRTPDGEAYYLAMTFLVEHGQSTPIHELSAAAYANWNPLPPTEQEDET